MMKIDAEVLTLLTTEKFCSFATTYQDSPHVCLMNFTYLPDEQLIILSSRFDTTKVKNIKANQSVALLLHSPGDETKKPLSCTLFGQANVAGPDKAARYREKHYAKHKDMGVFIVGTHIAIITVEVKHAELSDVKDNVVTW